MPFLGMAAGMGLMCTGQIMAIGRHMDDVIVPNKDLGQHWLNDQASLMSICDMADLSDRDTVLEIGPGLGSLSQYLINRAKQVVAVEFDEALVDSLKDKFKDVPKIKIEAADIRKFDLRQMPTDYKCVANIPYYLTSYLIRMLSESVNPPSLAVLLIQREVAERLCAKPGKLSVIGVISQVFWEIELGMIVPSKLFNPPPAVDSQIIKLKRRKESLVPINQQKNFMRLVRIGFSQKRKTLINSLSGGFRISKDQASDYLTKAGLKPMCRAQELSIDDWLRLTGVIFA